MGQVIVLTKRRREAARKRRDKLVVAHLALVERIAEQVYRRYTKYGDAGYTFPIELDELIAAGNHGLVEAASRYDKSQGEFEKYAFWRIRGAMIDSHKRAAYRESQHVSYEAMLEEWNWLPDRIELDQAPAPDDAAAKRQQARLLARAVDELPDDLRHVFSRSVAGFSIASIAVEMGRSVAWTRAKLAEARAQLGARVISWGIGMDRAA